MRKISLLIALVSALFVSQARADFTAKDAAAATITFKNPGACTSVVCVPVFQLYDGTNVVTLTTAGADAVSNTLTGQPVYGRLLGYNGTTWDRLQVDGSKQLKVIEANSAAILTAVQAAIPPGTNPIGNVGIIPLTSGGLATSSTIVTTANGVLSVKGSAGQVYKIEVSNNQAPPAWLKLYNSASAPTAGSGTPVRRILIPGNSSGVVFSASYEAGLAFSTGIGYALTGLIADNDTTAVTASVLVVNIDYK